MKQNKTTKRNEEMPKKKKNPMTKFIIWLMIIALAGTSLLSGLTMFF